MVLIVMGRQIIRDDPFPLLIGLQTWQVGCPFISMPALVFLNLFLSGLRAELPTQVFGFAAVGVRCDCPLGLWHFLGSLLGRFLLGATGPGISDLQSTTGITFCPLVGRFQLLAIRIAVTPCQFDIGVIGVATTCWSVWIWVLWSCHLRALPRGYEHQHFRILRAHASPIPCSDRIQYIFGTVARATRNCLLRCQCMFPWHCWRSKGRIQRRRWHHWRFCWCCTRSLRWCCIRSLLWHCIRFHRCHRRFGWCERRRRDE